MATALESTTSAANAIQRVHFSHDAMIDLILSRPGVSQNEIAKYFGYTAPWVSRIICSDAFQARLAARKEVLVDPLITQNFEERLKGLAASSLDIIQQKLEAAPSFDMAHKTLELTTKALGFGARDRNGPQISQTFVVALPAKAESQEQWAEQARRTMAPLPNVQDVSPKGA